jgi:chromosome segregation ATPase
MITLTEKRLQDLEARIPTFLAKIEEQQAKMAEIYTFPDHLAELRWACKTWNEFVKDFINSQHAAWDTSNIRTDGFWKELKDLKSAIDNEVKANLASLSGQISALNSSQDNQKALQTTLDNNHHDLMISLFAISERVSYTENKIQKSAQDLGNTQDRLNQLAVDHNNLKVSLEAKVDDLRSILKDAVYSITSSMNSQITQVSNRIKEPPVIPVPKDYDADIEKIKAAIEVLSVPTIQTDPKVNDKIKSLEQAIAQIFTLLKKLEPGS